MKAYLQTKTGEIEGEVVVETIQAANSLLHWCVFKAPLVELEVDPDFPTEAAALSHFEKNFGRIIREDG